MDKELKTDAMYTLVYCKFRLFFFPRLFIKGARGRTSLLVGLK